MILLIDQGNSALKWCCYHESDFTISEKGELSDLVTFVQNNDNVITDIYVSCVKNQQQVDLISHSFRQANHLQPIQVATSSDKFESLTNAYNEPAQLGVDRWLAMIAVWKRLQSGFIIVDAGSALTLDIVDSSGQHLGGHIVPGLSMQTKLLISDTDGIAVDSGIKTQAYVPGHSTTEAVLNGCLTNLSAYINEMYGRHGKDNSLPLFLTGGDANTLSAGITASHQLESDLVLQGLYYFLNSSDV